MNDHDLISLAEKASLLAYAPYSNFRVGAALLDEQGAVHIGCNIENRSYGLTLCAERSALSVLFSKGARRIKAVAVFGADSKTPLPPCGACRQVLSEFADPDCPVSMACPSGKTTSTVGALFPFDSLHDLRNPG